MRLKTKRKKRKEKNSIVCQKLQCHFTGKYQYHAYFSYNTSDEMAKKIRYLVVSGSIFRGIDLKCLICYEYKSYRDRIRREILKNNEVSLDHQYTFAIILLFSVLPLLSFIPSPLFYSLHPHSRFISIEFWQKYQKTLMNESML